MLSKVSYCFWLKASMYSICTFMSFCNNIINVCSMGELTSDSNNNSKMRFLGLNDLLSKKFAILPPKNSWPRWFTFCVQVSSRKSAAGRCVCETMRCFGDKKFDFFAAILCPLTGRHRLRWHATRQSPCKISFHSVPIFLSYTIKSDFVRSQYMLSAWFNYISTTCYGLNKVG